MMGPLSRSSSSNLLVAVSPALRIPALPAVGHPARHGLLGQLGQEFIQFPRAIERREVVVTAHMALADEDLRHGPATAALLQHDFPLAGDFVHLDLAKGRAFALEQVPRTLAVAAPRG